MLGGIHHVSIAMDDLEEGRDFYAGLLELAEVDGPNPSGAEYWFQAGACQIQLTQRPPDQESGLTGFGAGETHLAFEAAQIDTVKARLETAGVEVRDAFDPEAGRRQIFFRDPSNNLLEVFCTI